MPEHYDTEDTEQSDPEILDREELQGHIKLALDDAADYVENELGVLRAEATLRYKGAPYGDEEDGRSSIVSRVLRDAVMQVLPSLMDIFAGPEHVVEFEPERADAEDAAKQRTDYINLVFTRRNPGFAILYGGVKDALIRRYAVFKWWQDERVDVRSDAYHGLLENQVMELSNNPDVVDISFEVDGAVEIPPDADSLVPDPMSPDAPPPSPTEMKTYKVRVKMRREQGWPRVALIPGEEFLIDRYATGIEDAKIVAHRQGVSRSDLVALGYSPTFIEEHEGSGAFTFETAAEPMARDGQKLRLGTDEVGGNRDLDEILYTEVWLRVDQDGDGIAELHKICCLGDHYFIAKIEDADEIPFAVMSPDPEPHEFAGQGYFEILEDIQRIDTVLTRSTLDGAIQANMPRLAINEQLVNLADVLNTELGAVIRSKGDPRVTIAPVETPFNGMVNLSLLEYFRTVKEERAGIPRASVGLDADALQSTTRAAVTAQVSAGQQRIKLLARVFAETGIKPVFMGLQRLVMRHQNVAEIVRLRGKYVEVDPSTWNAPLDLRVNVGLGTGAIEERMARLQVIAAEQKEILLTLGPANPLVTLDRFRNTLAKMAELTAEGDPDTFFGEIPQGYVPPEPETPPDPALLLAEAQAKEIEARIQIEQMKVAQQREEMHLKDGQERAKISANIHIEAMKLEAQYSIDIQEQRISAAVEAARQESDERIATTQAQVQAAQGGPSAQ